MLSSSSVTGFKRASISFISARPASIFRLRSLSSLLLSVGDDKEVNDSLLLAPEKDDEDDPDEGLLDES
jgi:hypothetical protein